MKKGLILSLVLLVLLPSTALAGWGWNQSTCKFIQVPDSPYISVNDPSTVFREYDFQCRNSNYPPHTRYNVFTSSKLIGSTGSWLTHTSYSMCYEAAPAQFKLEVRGATKQYVRAVWYNQYAHKWFYTYGGLPYFDYRNPVIYTSTFVNQFIAGVASQGLSLMKYGEPKPDPENCVFGGCNLKIENFAPPIETVDLGFGQEPSIDVSMSGDADQVRWIIEIAGETQPLFTTTRPPGSVSFGWDEIFSGATHIAAGVYTVTVRVEDVDDPDCGDTVEFQVNIVGSESCKLFVPMGSSANIANGNLSHSQAIFSSSGTGLTTSINLYYKSLDPINNSLGRGWSHNYDTRVIEQSTGDVILKKGTGESKLYLFSGGSYQSPVGDYSTLVKNGDGSFTLTKKEGTEYNFDSDGNLGSIADRNGNTQAFTYTDGNLTSIADSNGLITSLSYDGDNDLTEIIDPGGNRYLFVVAGDILDSVIYPDGGEWLFTYDANGFMLTKTDPAGNTTTYSYDAEYRVETSIDPEGRVRSISYPDSDEAIRTTVVTEKDGSERQLTYDTETGNLLEEVDALGGVTTYTYDENNNLLSETDPAGRTTTYVYDENGNRTSITDPLGQTTTYTYNEYGQVFSSTDSDGGTTTYEYDASGNLIKLTDSAGAATQYQYDAAGRVIAITNANGQTMTITYDSNGNMASVTDFTGATTTFQYDASGNMTSQMDSFGNTTTFEYDSRGNMISMTDPQGNVTTYTYDANGNRTSQTDANGNTTFFTYNSQGQVIQVEDPLGNITIYTYGGSSGCSACSGGIDKLKEVIDPNGNATTYSYDYLGRLLSEADPLGNTTSYSYNSVGNMTSRTDANGNTINYSYDALGRLITKTYPDGTGETYTYDSSSNMLTAANKHISYTMSYDSQGRLLSLTDSNDKSISYQYDALGNKINMTSEGKTVVYDYDAGNRLAGIDSWAGEFGFEYDELGRRTSLTFPNGVVTSYSYDTSSRLTDLITANSKGDILAGYNYTHDNVGNRLSKTENGETLNYSYDAIYRLLEAVSDTPGNGKSNGNGKNNGKVNGKTKGKINSKNKGIVNAVQNQKESYEYDPVGNRLAGPDKNDSYDYNNGNQLTEDKKAQYTYDANGNTISRTTDEGATSFVYDYENRLVKVVTPENTVTFKYDPFGRRIEKSVDGKVKNYFYDQEDILFEYDVKGDTGNSYIHGPGIDEPLALEQRRRFYYYHADGLGSIVSMTDARAKVVQTYEYDSFGNLHDQKNRIKQPYAFTAREWDRETRLYFYRARYYDAEAGRFITKDPIGFNGGDLNLYGYVQNNAINGVDPWGLEPGAPYLTIDDAAITAIKDINPTSIKLNREYGGYIYGNDDCTYSYSKPVQGSEHGMNLLIPSYAVGWYHTHGDNLPIGTYRDEDFSGGREGKTADRGVSNRRGIPGYLGTPTYQILRYDPSTKKTINITP